MKLDYECRGCLYNSQMKKVEKEQGDGEKLQAFRDGVKALCDNPPPHYCAPLLMRDINNLHRDIFGEGIDYSREKSQFNLKLLSMEDGLFSRVINSSDPIAEGLKFAMAANYIDFARMSDLGEESIDAVLAAAERASVDKIQLEKLKSALAYGKTLCYLHDNCGEVVLDKVLIRAIKKLYPQIEVTSVVRGYPVINDVTLADAEQVGLTRVCKVVGNGSDIPGTCLDEVSAEVKNLLSVNDVIISKGLGNLETLYGEGYKIFYAFNCKCGHISKQFNYPLWSAVLVSEV